MAASVEGLKSRISMDDFLLRTLKISFTANQVFPSSTIL